LVVAGDQAGDTAFTTAGFLPVAGGAVDGYDIGTAWSEGNYGEVIVTGGLALAPGSARALRRIPDVDRLATRGARLINETIGNVAQSATRACDINSFEAGTFVETINGPVPIEDIGVGTYVLGYNEETGEIGYYPVTDLISHLDFKVVYLTIDGEVIVTTAEHPFYTAEGEWVDAIDLRVGDEIRTAEWTTGVVESVYEVTRPQPMYNFTVDVAHTYFVGKNQWLVHNASCELWKDRQAARHVMELILSGDEYGMFMFDANIPHRLRGRPIHEITEWYGQRGRGREFQQEFIDFAEGEKINDEWIQRFKDTINPPSE